jgi:hypothetical protein
VKNSINKEKEPFMLSILIRKWYAICELKQLVSSNYYSILSLNAEIRFTPVLRLSLKPQILSASNYALKPSTTLYYLNNEFVSIHSNIEQ